MIKEIFDVSIASQSASEILSQLSSLVKTITGIFTSKTEKDIILVYLLIRHNRKITPELTITNISTLCNKKVLARLEENWSQAACSALEDLAEIYLNI